MQIYRIKYGQRFIVIACLLFFPSFVVCASEVASSFISNPIPMINSSAYMVSNRMTSNASSALKMTMNYQFQKAGLENTESSSIAIAGGSADRFFYVLSRGFGQPSEYFSRSSLGVQLVKRLVSSNFSGYYKYWQESYSFGQRRQIEIGSDYSDDRTTINLGMGMESIDSMVALQYVIFFRHDLKYVEGKIQVKAYIGPQFIVDNMQVNSPEFGMRLNMKGEWLFVGMPQNMHLTYGLNGVVVNGVIGQYRRFGVEIGLVYLY